MSVSLKHEVRDAALGDHRLTAGLGKVMEELGCKEVNIHRILGSAMTINVGVK